MSVMRCRGFVSRVYEGGALQLRLDLIRLGPGKSPEPVSARFDDNERLHQFILRICVKDSHKLIVDGILRRGKHAQIQNSSSEPTGENKHPIVSVPRNQEPDFFSGSSKEILIVCLRETSLTCEEDVVPHLSEEPSCHRVHVLVKQKLHAGRVVRWISSADTRAIA